MDPTLSNAFRLPFEALTTTALEVWVTHPTLNEKRKEGMSKHNTLGSAADNAAIASLSSKRSSLL